MLQRASCGSRYNEKALALGAKPKIVHLTSVHDASDVRIFHKECRSLIESGYDVVLVAASRKKGHLDGLRVRVIPTPVNRRQRLTQTIAQVYLAALKENGLLYHFHDPELIAVGLLLKLSGKRVVYDVHEDLPRQVLSKHWIPAWLRPLIAKSAEAVEALASRAFDGIVTVTPTIVNRFPKSKTIMVRNFPVLEEISEGCPYRERPPTVVYIGVVSENRGIREMVQAVAMVPPKFQARFVIAGNFSPPELESEATVISGRDYVSFLGWQSRSDVARLLKQARVGLVLLHPLQNYLESYPVKLFEYMAAGIPVVASDFPLWRQIIEPEGCGLVVDPLNPGKIAEAIEWLLNHPRDAEEMGKAGRQAVLSKYNWQREAKELTRAYLRLV